jgi:hypothetical protein
LKRLEVENNIWISVDEEDFELIKNYPWKIAKYKNGSAYCYYNLKVEEKKYKKIWLQHHILGDLRLNKRIYFKDKNPLNCCRANIELLTHSEFAHITHKEKEEKYLGVISTYVARIRVNKKLKVIGTFSNAIDAAIAYDEEAKKVFGKYAVLNFN